MLNNDLIEKLIIVASIIVVYLILCKILKITSEKAMEKTHNIATSFNFRMAQTILSIIMVIAIMLQFEATKEIYSSILTNISLIVVVLGFIVQESLTNILSGIMISKSKPFDIGQRVVIEEKNITGTIEEITLQHTVIKKANNATVIIPNSIMNTAIIENSAYNGENAIANFLDISVSYESDIDKAIKIITEIVISHPSFLKDKTCSTLVRNLGASGYDVRAIVWTSTVAENFQTCSDLRVAIKKAFDENNIIIPYNRVEVSEFCQPEKANIIY